MRWQAIVVELDILSIFMLRENLKPFRARRRFFLEFKLLFLAFLVLFHLDFVQFCLAFSQKLFFIRELPDRRLVLLAVLQLNTKEGQYIVANLVTELEHDFVAFWRTSFDLVPKV